MSDTTSIEEKEEEEEVVEEEGGAVLVPQARTDDTDVHGEAITTTATTIVTEQVSLIQEESANAENGYFSKLKASANYYTSTISSAANTVATKTSNAVSTVAIKAKNLGRENGPLKRVIVEVKQARNLVCMGENGRADPFVELKFGSQTRCTHTVFKNLDPVFKESFEFSSRSVGGRDSVLTGTVYHTDLLTLHDSMGTFEIDIGVMPVGEEYYKWCPLKNAPPPNKRGLRKNRARDRALLEAGRTVSIGEGPGEVLVTVSVSEYYEPTLTPMERVEMKASYCGWVKAHILQVHDLSVTDASCDPYLVVRSGNKIYRSGSMKNNPNPTFDALFELPVRDIYDVIEISVMNEDRNGRTDFIAGILIPLLKIQSGEWQTYLLKDANHLVTKEKSAITLCMNFEYDLPKGIISLFQKRDARDIDEAPPFSFTRMRSNAERVKKILITSVERAKWVDKVQNFDFGLGYNLGLLFGWIIFWALFEVWFIPCGLILYILRQGVDRARNRKDETTKKNPFTPPGTPTNNNTNNNNESSSSSPKNSSSEESATKKKDEIELELDDEDDAASIMSLRNLNKLLKMRGLLQIGQNLLHDGLDHLERLDNLTNWSNPVFTGIICLILINGAIVLYLLPLRLIPISGGLAIFGRAALLHYLPTLKKARKNGFRSRLHDFIQDIPSPIHVAIDTFWKFPSNTDLIRQKNLVRTDIEKPKADVKIELSLLEDSQALAKRIKQD